METLFTLATIANAYTTKTFDNENERIVFSDDVNLTARDTLLDIQRKIDVWFDLSYTIVSDAVSALVDGVDYESEEFASVYTSTRLSYLSNTNQFEISDIIKEYDTRDIATACAVWYDEKVREACRLIEAQLEEGEEEEIDE